MQRDHTKNNHGVAEATGISNREGGPREQDNITDARTVHGCGVQRKDQFANAGDHCSTLSKNRTTGKAATRDQ